MSLSYCVFPPVHVPLKGNRLQVCTCFPKCKPVKNTRNAPFHDWVIINRDLGASIAFSSEVTAYVGLRPSEEGVGCVLPHRGFLSGLLVRTQAPGPVLPAKPTSVFVV